MTAEQVPAEVVDDGQGITVDTVAHQELPFEIDRPDLIRCGCVEGRGTRMLPTPAAAPRLGPAMALQDVEHGAARGPSPFREAGAKALQDLPCAPSVPLVLLQNKLDQLRRRLVWTGSRRPAVILESNDAALTITVEPLVTGDPTDAVPDAELAHCPVATFDVLHEALSFEHRVVLQPGHPSSSRASSGSVSHVPGHL